MSGACVKCGGIEHYGQEVCVLEGSINLLPVNGFFQYPYLAMRICGTCGHVEFKAPERFLEKVREKLPKVP